MLFRSQYVKISFIMSFTAPPETVFPFVLCSFLPPFLPSFGLIIFYYSILSFLRLFNFFKLKIYFDIVVDSYAVVRNNTERSHVLFTQFCPMVTYCKTLVHVSQPGYQEWTSLVAQWLRIHLPMQETQVRAPVQEDPTCHRETKPVSFNY